MRYSGILLFIFTIFFFVFLLPKTGISQEIETIVIGDQVWMAKNLDLDVLGSRCYNDDSLNCVRYGRLYVWHAAINACPDGFRLPTDEDWGILTNYVGGVETAGAKLKQKGDSGLNLIYAGNYQPEAKMFSFKDEKGYYWSATPGGFHTAWIRLIHLGKKNISRSEIGKSFYFSIRCIKVD